MHGQPTANAAMKLQAKHWSVQSESKTKQHKTLSDEIKYFLSAVAYLPYRLLGGANLQKKQTNERVQFRINKGTHSYWSRTFFGSGRGHVSPALSSSTRRVLTPCQETGWSWTGSRAPCPWGIARCRTGTWAWRAKGGAAGWHPGAPWHRSRCSPRTSRGRFPAPPPKWSRCPSCFARRMQLGVSNALRKFTRGAAQAHSLFETMVIVTKHCFEQILTQACRVSVNA